MKKKISEEKKKDTKEKNDKNCRQRKINNKSLDENNCACSRLSDYITSK